MRTAHSALRSKESYARKPGRPPDAVLDNRISEAIQVLASRPNVQRCQLHKLFCVKWNCHWRTVDRMVACARRAMLERLNRSRETFRCEVLAGYERELASDKATVRLAALDGICELLGLCAPRRIEASGPNAGPIPVAEKCVIIELPLLEGQAAIDETRLAECRARAVAGSAAPVISGSVIASAADGGNGDDDGHGSETVEGGNGDGAPG
jgi:hypothetical protein